MSEYVRTYEEQLKRDKESFVERLRLVVLKAIRDEFGMEVEDYPTVDNHASIHLDYDYETFVIEIGSRG